MRKVFSNSRHRTIILMCATAFLLTVFLFTLQVYRDYKNEVTRARIQAANTTLVLAKHFEDVYKNIDLVLLGAMDVIQERGFRYTWNAERYYSLLSQRSKRIPEISTIRVANENGDYQGHSDNALAEPYNIADRAYFISHKYHSDLGLVISKPVMGRASKRPVVTLSRRLSGKKGEFRGIISATLPLQFFKDQLQELNVGPKGNLTLVSLNDRILMARSTATEPVDLKKPVPIPPELERILAENQNVGTWESVSLIDGLEKTYSVNVNQKYNFYIINGLAKTDYLAGWRANLFWTASAMSFVFVIFLLGLYYFLQSLDRLEEQRNKISEKVKMSFLGEMAAGVAHEVNNPLAIIQLKTDAMRMILESQSLDIKSLLRMIDGIEKSVQRAAKIIGSLRTYAKQEKEALKIPVSLEDIFAKTLSLSFEKIVQQHIQLRLNPVPSVDIECVDSEIIQVLLNLISNSYDAVLDLPVDQRWIEISFEASMARIKIIITDSGPGIPKSISDKMMNPFFTTKPVGKGTGLGLSTSKSVIERHEGQLYLNEHATNTQFVIDLKATPHAVLMAA